MSTRYVWDKYNPKVSVSFALWDRNVLGGGDENDTYVVCSAYEANVDENDKVRITPSGNVKYLESGDTADTAVYTYAVRILSESGFISPSSYDDIIAKSTSEGEVWVFAAWSGHAQISQEDGRGNGVDIEKGDFSISKGTKIARISSQNKSAYPSNSLLNGFYYVYLGYDSIDPSAVTISGNPAPEKTISVNVLPKSPAYGGTISYLYQYSANGGAWANIQTTTATSIDFIVPVNAKTVQFRVRAQDNMGFTSTTYVTSTSIVVEQLNALVGVSDNARKGVDLSVSPNGQARNAIEAYIGVDGKARRFL